MGFFKKKEAVSINNDDFGGFMISKNIIENNIPLKYSFREESSIQQLNGWNLLSENDDDDYINDPNNFAIINATTLFKIAPLMQNIFNAPYGTDICWLYENNKHTGFYDLALEKETTIEKIVGNK